MNPPRWEHFPHDTDIGIRGIGNKLNEAFEQAALAMTAAVTDLQWVKASEVVTITCQAPDNEDVYVYFDNDTQGAAPLNARTLTTIMLPA